MSRKICFGALLIFIVTCRTTLGSVYVTLIPHDAADRQLLVGERLTLSLAIGATDFAVAGFSIDLNCISTGIRICDVIFDHNFILPLEGEQQLPGIFYRTTRVQSPDDIDEWLGTFGEEVQIATITLEVMTDGPFDSGLSVDIATSTMDTEQPETLIRVGENGEFRVGPVIVPIINREPRPEYNPPTLESESATIEFHEIGSNGIVSVLEVGRPYELHYSTQAAGADAFVIFGVADSAGTQTFEAIPPSSGQWASPANFLTQQAPPGSSPAQAIGFPEGSYRTDTVMNDLIQSDGTTTAAAPTGHIVTLTPLAEANLRLEAYLFYTDEVANTLTEIAATVSIPVHAAQDASTNGDLFHSK
jgi:hypothetical protein